MSTLVVKFKARKMIKYKGLLSEASDMLLMDNMRHILSVIMFPPTLSRRMIFNMVRRK